MSEEQKIDIEDESKFRTVKYQFGPMFFKLGQVAGQVTFVVGNKPVKNFRMIERHYYKDYLIKSSDFSFPFCIPNSKNTWEHIYDMPKIPKEIMEEMIANPFETRSDSFYFVENKLIMHTKAEYDFS